MNFTDFPVGPFYFSTGGVIFLFGVILCTWMLTRTVHEKGLSLSFLNDKLILFAIGGFLAGRLGAMGRFWSYFEEDYEGTGLGEQSIVFFKKFFIFWHGGLDPFWTGIGFLFLFLVIAVVKKENYWKWFDAFVLPTLLLLMFWNIGAFFSGWDYGRPVSENFPFGVTYNMMEVRYSVPVHPVQLYSFFYFFLLFIVGLKWWYKHFSKKDGTFFGTVVLFVFIGNGILEFFRGDTTTMINLQFFEMRIPQFASFLLAFFSIFFLIFHTHRTGQDHLSPDPKEKTDAETSAPPEQ